MNDRKEGAKELSHTNRVGGLAFFVSLTFLCVLGFLNSLTLISLQSLATLPRWASFAGGSVVGFLVARYLFPERFCVFIHELKHSVISNLAGNRAKRFKVADRSGSFTYEYTKQTAAYNAFIALAPYWLPLFSIVGIPLAALALPESLTSLLLVAGLVWGADAALNVRDISPVQTDISGIRGGYGVGVLYIIAMNLTIFSIVGAWVSSGVSGLLALVTALWNILYELATAVLGA